MREKECVYYKIKIEISDIVGSLNDLSPSDIRKRLIDMQKVIEDNLIGPKCSKCACNDKNPNSYWCGTGCRLKLWDERKENEKFMGWELRNDNKAVRCDKYEKIKDIYY